MKIYPYIKSLYIFVYYSINNYNREKFIDKLSVYRTDRGFEKILGLVEQ